MFKVLSLAASTAFLVASCSHERDSHPHLSTDSPSAPVPAAAQTLEVGCAGCVFGMPGAEGCQLAVKVDGKSYLVTGVEMPGHESGLCDHSRMAELTGRLEGERFVATNLSLKP